MKADRKKVKRIMARAHMTVEDVARAAGMPPQTVAAIICGMNAQPETLIRIAQALKVYLTDIIQGVAPAPREWEAPPLPAGQVTVDPVRFRAELARSGLTIKGLAELAGVYRGTVSAILRGAEAHRAETWTSWRTRWVWPHRISQKRRARHEVLQGAVALPGPYIRHAGSRAAGRVARRGVQVWLN